MKDLDLYLRYQKIIKEFTTSSGPYKSWPTILEQMAEEIFQLREENIDLRGVLNLSNDEYAQRVGAWKIIQRLEEVEKMLTVGLFTANERIATLKGHLKTLLSIHGCPCEPISYGGYTCPAHQVLKDTPSDSE